MVRVGLAVLAVLLSPWWWVVAGVARPPPDSNGAGPGRRGGPQGGGAAGLGGLAAGLGLAGPSAAAAATGLNPLGISVAVVAGVAVVVVFAVPGATRCAHRRMCLWWPRGSISSPGWRARG